MKWIRYFCIYLALQKLCGWILAGIAWVMPQTGDQLEQPLSLACDGVSESNERLLKPSQKSPPQKNGMPSPPSENGSVKSGISQIPNCLVISANGGMPSQAKTHSNGYVCTWFVLRVCTSQAARGPVRAQKLNAINGPCWEAYGPGQGASKIIPEICVI